MESEESPLRWTLERVEAYREERKRRALASPPPPARAPHERAPRSVAEVYEAFESFALALGREEAVLTPMPGGLLLLPEDKVRATGLAGEALEALLRYRFLVQTRFGLAIPQKTPYGGAALGDLLRRARLRTLEATES